MDNNTCTGIVIGGAVAFTLVWLLSKQNKSIYSWSPYPGASIALPAALGARGATWGAYPGVKLNLS